jgi:signal transduction histidine kinase/HAMP domain-containing protein
MRKRLIFSLSLLFALFTLGSVFTMLYIYRTTNDLRSVIALHRVEIIRQNLVINAQTVQTHLYTIGTQFGKDLDVIVENVTNLDNSVKSCMGCHHNAEMSGRLNELATIVGEYKQALSTLITTSANPERLNRMRTGAIEIGTQVLGKSQEMAFIADKSLNEKTVSALKEINNSRSILIVTLFISFFIALAIAISMTRKITEPISNLVAAIRRIKLGELGYVTDYKGPDEFGELVNSFNDMSSSLKENNQRIMHYLHNLSNLYSITLTFHSISTKSDIFRELVNGVVDLTGAEQCGLLLREAEEGDFAHMEKAVGVSPETAARMNVKGRVFDDLYAGTKRRALVLNENLELSPTYEMDKDLGVRNIMFVWVRQKRKLLGAIRVANKREGNFTEEDFRLLAILSNNFSVALENWNLYEDIRRQMNELKDAQEQLIQAAKLVAIGELASNVAHEINNPLTSILGYAELMKEEQDPANILKDVEIIERESLRAREIVLQLLEFSKKKPLELKVLDINRLVQNVLELTAIQFKGSGIGVEKDYGQIPLIRGDENQLKQVFLNIINNALYSMEGRGLLGIKTYVAGEMVNIEISDTGKGIPKEILPRIFEPFFTTKKEKGTGLGLSISYKIVQSHNGRIEVESEEMRGSRFIVRLPIALGVARAVIEKEALKSGPG